MSLRKWSIVRGVSRFGCRLHVEDDTLDGVDIIHVHLLGKSLQFNIGNGNLK